LFENKIILDVGCGTGILSFACLQFCQPKQIIAVDKSDIIYDAMAIAKENNIDDSKLMFIHGRIEDISLPVEKVDIIISEWMGYFLLFECMLESIIYARDNYLNLNGGLVLPDQFSLNLAGFHSDKIYSDHISYWSDVYGFKMTTISKNILADGHVMAIEEQDLMTTNCCIKDLDMYTATIDDISFTNVFSVEMTKTGQISAFVGYFDVQFDKNLTQKVHFSTSPSDELTHWKQTVFFLPKLFDVTKGDKINGKIVCSRHPKEKRGLIIHLHVFDLKLKYYFE